MLATWPPGRRPVRFDPNHNEQFATMTQFTRLQELFNCIIVQMVVVQLTFLVYHRSIDYCLIGSWSTGKCRKCHLFNCQIVKLVFGQLNIGEMAVCSVVLLLNCPFVQFFTLFSQFLFNRPGSHTHIQGASYLWCQRLRETAPAGRPKLRRGIRLPIFHKFLAPCMCRIFG